MDVVRMSEITSNIPNCERTRTKSSTCFVVHTKTSEIQIEMEHTVRKAVKQVGKNYLSLIRVLP